MVASMSISIVPMAKPMPIMGPMRGEMSMAPMMTAVELTFRPSEAMRMAKMSTQRLPPRKVMPALTRSMMACSFSLWGRRFR